MKRRSVTCTHLCSEIGEVQHNINKLLDHLSAGQELKLPIQLQMNSITIQGRRIERKLDAGKINQVWRYGGCCVRHSNLGSPSSAVEDKNIENQLMRISEWIEQELNA